MTFSAYFMPFKTLDTTIHFPVHRIETDLTQIIKKHFRCPPGETDGMVTFLFEVREEFIHNKVSPDIAFISVFKKWCRRYAGRPILLEEIQIHSCAIIEYLVSNSRALDTEQSKEWSNVLCTFIREEIDRALHNHLALRLTK